MEIEDSIPTSLQEAIIHFADLDVCHEFMTRLRFPNGACCVHCGSIKLSFIKTRRIWQCLDCKKQFSIKVGTIFEDSALKLSTWLPAFWMLANSKNGISSCELARALNVTQKTAWFMLHRIRHVLSTGTIEKIGGEVEADETYIGGKESNKHFDKKLNKGRGAVGKTVVMALLERPRTNDAPSVVIADVIPSTAAKVIGGKVRNHVAPGSALYTDAHPSYRPLASEYMHEFVDHAVEYVRASVHTNGLENFFSLLKRGIKGTYVSIQPFHLSAYIDEQVFRFNNRKYNDAGRFLAVMMCVSGRRLTYKTLTASYLPYYDVVLPKLPH